MLTSAPIIHNSNEKIEKRHTIQIRYYCGSETIMRVTTFGLTLKSPALLICNGCSDS